MLNFRSHGHEEAKERWARIEGETETSKGKKIDAHIRPTYSYQAYERTNCMVKQRKTRSRDLQSSRLKERTEARKACRGRLAVHKGRERKYRPSKRQF